jgi:uncharacterized membrane protein
MIGLDALGIAAGLLPATVAIHHAMARGEPRRWRNSLFWGAFAVTLMAGPWLPNLVNGLLVLLMVATATTGLRPAPVSSTGEAERQTLSQRYGMRLFLPALCVPVVTLAGTLLIPNGTVFGWTLIDPKQVTLVSLATAILAGLALACWITRPPRSAPAAEARRLSDAIGWPMILPQMLAALGGIFAAAGVGNVVADGVAGLVPIDTPLVATLLYCVGMALFTIVMGNAFAAFPIMTAGIGIPFLIHRFGGDPAAVAALGMLAGFCGTLMTPMAANFNIVPAALLELRDRYAVIRVQVPTAVPLLLFTITVMALFAFPGAFR